MPDTLQQPTSKIGLTQLVGFRQWFYVNKNLLNHFLWLLEKWHKVWHAFCYRFLLCLLLAFEQLCNSLFNHYQILVSLKERCKNSQKYDITHAWWSVDESFQNLQNLLCVFHIFSWKIFYQLNTNFHRNFVQSNITLIGSELEYQKLKDITKKRRFDWVKVERNEEGEGFEALLIKFLVEKLIEGLAEHLKNGLDLLRFHFFLDKYAELFNSFLWVFL